MISLQGLGGENPLPSRRLRLHDVYGAPDAARRTPASAGAGAATDFSGSPGEPPLLANDTLEGRDQPAWPLSDLVSYPWCR